jgi:hypothetical protein
MRQSLRSPAAEAGPKDSVPLTAGERKEVSMKPMLIVIRHAPVGALLAGAVILAGLAVALPLLAAFAPPETDADQAP